MRESVLLARRRARQSGTGRPLDLAPDLGVDRAQRVPIDDASLEELRREPDERIARTGPFADRRGRTHRVPGPRDLRVAPDELGERAVVARPARGAGLDEERALARADARGEVANQ